MNHTELTELGRQIEAELTQDILEFWLEHAVDRDGDGFHGYISRDLRADRDHDRAAVLYTRILWAFSAAYGRYGDARYMAAAERARRYVAARFIDREHGGVFWAVDHTGNAADTKKQTYAQAFAIYALAEHHRATGDRESLALARAVYGAVEAHCRAADGSGYAEALSRDWQPLADVSLSGKDMNAARTMNTHLHLLEAYTGLYGVWKDEGLRRSLQALLDVMLGRVLLPEGRFGLFFDERWQPLTGTVSYGHDIEGSWLLCEAADALGDAGGIRRARAAAAAMAERVLLDGVDGVYGGVMNERHAGTLDTGKVWWVQAEAVVGFLNAYELTGDARFADAAAGAWRFIRAHIVDREYGEWVWQTARDGAASPPDEKAGPWKCPYHNTRMCLQALERIGRLSKGRRP